MTPVEYLDAILTELSANSLVASFRQQLRRRWDNVEHYPALIGFPHHIHLADGQLVPSGNLSIMDLLRALVL